VRVLFRALFVFKPGFDRFRFSIEKGSRGAGSRLAPAPFETLMD
jgi:hypothetical protein